MSDTIAVVIKISAHEWVDVYGPCEVRHLATDSSDRVRILFLVRDGIEVLRQSLAEKKGRSTLTGFLDGRTLALSSAPGDWVTIDGPFRYTYSKRIRGFPRAIRFSIDASVETQITRENAHNKTPNTRRKKTT